MIIGFSFDDVMGEDEDYDLEYSEDFSTSACSEILKSEQ
mgnify:CR=1 FL=1